jgi:hypothetical protein
MMKNLLSDPPGNDKTSQMEAVITYPLPDSTGTSFDGPVLLPSAAVTATSSGISEQ